MDVNPTIETEIGALSPSERIVLVQEIWDRIAAEPDRVPLSPTHGAELDARLEALARNPDSGRPWAEVREELLGL